MNFKAYLKSRTDLVNKALERCLPKAGDRPTELHEAMRYAVLGDGKRIRPMFAIAACEAVGGKAGDVLSAACALELIHNYSLVHDDLPCMDDDDTRRGQPTCHVKYSEATAVLVGDALLTLAFQLTLSADRREDPRKLRRRIEAAKMIAEASGTRGMVGGQALDMEFQEKELDLPSAEYINTHKTGALIAVSTRVGAYLGGGSDAQVRALGGYGQCVGLLFQIVDDIMDNEGYAKVMGVAEARRRAEALLESAKKKISRFGKKGLALAALADYTMNRNR